MGPCWEDKRGVLVLGLVRRDVDFGRRCLQTGKMLVIGGVPDCEAGYIARCRLPMRSGRV